MDSTGEKSENAAAVAVGELLSETIGNTNVRYLICNQLLFAESNMLPRNRRIRIVKREKEGVDKKGEANHLHFV